MHPGRGVECAAADSLAVAAMAIINHQRRLAQLIPQKAAGASATQRELNHPTLHAISETDGRTSLSNSPKSRPQIRISLISNWVYR